MRSSIFERLTTTFQTIIPLLEHYSDSDSDSQLDSNSDNQSDFEIFWEADNGSCTEYAGIEPAEKLSKLPPEIIYSIAQYLPPESAAVLSLTCRYLFDILSEKYLNLVTHERYKSCADNLYKYLLLLEHEFPDHIACKDCRVLHYVTKQVASRYIPPTRDIGECCYLYEYLSIRNLKDASWFLSTILFRKAIRQFQQKQDDTKYYLRLLSPKELRLCNSSTIQWSCSLAKIRQGELYIRRQTIWTPCPTELNLRWFEFLCPHIIMHNSFGGIKFCSIIGDRTHIMMANPYSIEEDNRIFQCQFCFTEYHIDFKKFDNKSVSLVCTTWHELGEGKKDLDTKLRRHIYRSWALRGLGDVNEVSFQPGSIKDTFEQGSEFGFNPLISRSETRDLLKISKVLLRKGGKTKVADVRKRLGEFFDHRRDFYVGCKVPEELYGENSESKDEKLSDFEIESLRYRKNSYHKFDFSAN